VKTREQRRMRATIAKLVVFALVCSVVGTMVILLLAGEPVGSTDIYRARFADVSGLKKGDRVRVSGVIVGKVDAITLIRPGDVDVRFSVNRNQTVTTSTHAVVRYANLLGQRFLALTRVGDPGSRLDPGATIPPSRTAPALSLTALFNGFQPLFASLKPADVNHLTEEIVRMLQGQGGTIDGLFSETAQLTSHLATRADEIQQVIASFSRLAGVVAQHDSGIADMLTSLHRLSGQLASEDGGIDDVLTSVGGLTSSVRALLSGVRRVDPRGTATDLAVLANTAAKNDQLLSRTLDKFPAAFTTFDRITQNGGWINAYPCTVSAVVIGTPTITADQIKTLVLDAVGGGGIAATVASLLSGLVPIGIPVPFTLPEGAVGHTDTGSAVCR
jgi:phospholipid/cholesterol/gamma-HCH transport system substrate-binding protein